MEIDEGPTSGFVPKLPADLFYPLITGSNA
jgi:hypothetical protein